MGRFHPPRSIPPSPPHAHRPVHGVVEMVEMLRVAQIVERHDRDVARHAGWATFHQYQKEVDLLLTTKDGNLWHRGQTAPNAGWGSWQPLVSVNPGISSGISVGYNADGRMEIFGMQGRGNVWHVWQTAPNGGWSQGGSLGAPTAGIMGSITAGNNHDGRLELFGVGLDH